MQNLNEQQDLQNTANISGSEEQEPIATHIDQNILQENNNIIKRPLEQIRKIDEI